MWWRHSRLHMTKQPLKRGFSILKHIIYINFQISIVVGQLRTWYRLYYSNYAKKHIPTSIFCLHKAAPEGNPPTMTLQRNILDFKGGQDCHPIPTTLYNPILDLLIPHSLQTHSTIHAYISINLLLLRICPSYGRSRLFGRVREENIRQGVPD